MSHAGPRGRVAGVILAIALTAVASPPQSSPSSVAAAPASTLPPKSPDSPTTSAASQTVTGMVLRVDPESPHLEVITGVGMALRVLRIRCNESTVIQAAEKAIRLSSLKRGDPVRVVCHSAAEGYLAIRIELLPKPESQGGPP